MHLRTLKPFDDSGPDEAMNAKAKELAEDLLAVVKEKWMEAQAVNQQHQGGYNAPQGYGGYGGYGQQPAGGYPGVRPPKAPLQLASKA